MLKHKINIAILIVWLFHITALIGISLGDVDWFIEKTPFNLSLCLLLFMLSYPIHKKRQIIAFMIFFAGGMYAEWLGVHYGILFGNYAYGSNFGFQIDGIPLLIGSYWGLLTFITAGILDYAKIQVVPKVILGAALMVILDFFMEYSAPIFDFWSFDENVIPIQNYISWYVLSMVFHSILRILKLKGNQKFSLNIYMAQLLFFMFFYFQQ